MRTLRPSLKDIPKMLRNNSFVTLRTISAFNQILKSIYSFYTYLKATELKMYKSTFRILITTLTLVLVTGYMFGQNSSTRYVASSVIPQKSHEIKLFNNLYSQTVGGSRNSFNTTLINYLYGAGKRFNFGFDARLRSVSLGPDSEGIFNVFGGSAQNRGGLTAFGPKIRWAFLPNADNFSLQSALTFPIGKELSGGNGDIYIDWDGPSWNTQFFNDFTLNDDLSLYAEIGFIWEDIGSADEGRSNQKSIPITTILQYFLSKDWTVYGLGNYAPFLQETTDFFYQYGIGTKVRFSQSFEVELLFTDFNRKILNDAGGQAGTYNLGVRYSIF